MAEQPQEKPSGFIAGVILLISSLGAVIFVTHHPTLGSPGYDNIAHEAVAEAQFNGLIHGALIAFSLGYYLALSVFSERLGKTHFEVRVAQLSITIAAATMAGAALISGFVVPDVAERFLSASDDATFRAQLVTLGAMNQALAKVGALGYGVAVFFWSVRLIFLPGVMRGVGVAGGVIGVLLAAGVLSERLALDVHGMTVILIAIGLWFCTIAFLLIRQRV